MRVTEKSLPEEFGLFQVRMSPLESMIALMVHGEQYGFSCSIARTFWSDTGDIRWTGREP